MVGAPVVVAAAAVWYLSRPMPPPRITDFVRITHDGHSKILGGTDGTRLYFTQSSPMEVVQVGVSGGEIAHVPVNVPAAEMELTDVSQDGSNALVGAVENDRAAAQMWISAPATRWTSQTSWRCGSRGIFPRRIVGDLLVTQRRHLPGPDRWDRNPQTGDGRPDSLWLEVVRPTEKPSGITRVVGCGRWRQMVQEFIRYFQAGMSRTFNVAAVGRLIGSSMFSFCKVARPKARYGLSMNDAGYSGGHPHNRFH